MDNYTVQSKAAYQAAVFAGRDLNSAVNWIKNELAFRTLREKLMRFYEGSAEELASLLRKGLCEIHTSGKEQESIRHNVANWFKIPKGVDMRTVSRNYAVEICFILGLDLDRSNELLRSVTGEMLHCRDVEELIVAYSLKNGVSYDRCRQLITSLASEVEPVGEQSAAAEKYTRRVFEEVIRLNDEAQLKRYIETHRDNFGVGHNTAYAYFTEMIDAMTGGWSDVGEGRPGTEEYKESADGDVAVKDIVDRYLFRRLVESKKGISAVAKCIRDGWPDQITLSRMKNRKIEVTRKVLILLYLACGGEVSREDAFGYDDMDAFMQRDDLLEEELTSRSDSWDFEAFHNQIDAMLVECGFAPLDPRLPFDWMVLLCIATDDLIEIDERFETFLSEMFIPEQQEAEETK